MDENHKDNSSKIELVKTEQKITKGSKMKKTNNFFV